MTPIQYTKNINGIACLVKVTRNVQKTYHSAEHYQIQFVSCSTKSADKNERKRIMKNERQKQNYKGMEPSRKRILLERKQAKDSTNKKELQKKRAQKYKTMGAFEKQRLLDKHAEKYNTMDAAKKQDLLDKHAEKYNTMDAAKKQDLLDKHAEKYNTMDAAKKQEMLEKRKQKFYSNKNKNVESCIEMFKKKIKEGPCYICCYI